MILIHYHLDSTRIATWAGPVHFSPPLADSGGILSGPKGIDWRRIHNSPAALEVDERRSINLNHVGLINSPILIFLFFLFPFHSTRQRGYGTHFQTELDPYHVSYVQLRFPHRVSTWLRNQFVESDSPWNLSEFLSDLEAPSDLSRAIRMIP